MVVYTKEEFLADREKVIQQMVEKAVVYINGYLKSKFKELSKIEVKFQDLKIDPDLDDTLVDAIFSRISSKYRDAGWKVCSYVDGKHRPYSLEFC